VSETVARWCAFRDKQRKVTCALRPNCAIDFYRVDFYYILRGMLDMDGAEWGSGATEMAVTAPFACRQVLYEKIVFCIFRILASADIIIAIIVTGAAEIHVMQSRVSVLHHVMIIVKGTIASTGG
jgi:hypothetical protein